VREGREEEQGRLVGRDGCLGLVKGNELVGVEVVMAMGQHAGSKIAHDGFGLDMQVTEHGVGPPAPKELDDVINAGTE